MGNNAYKIFSTSEYGGKELAQVADMDIKQCTKDFLIVCYNYLLPNSYKKVLNNAAKNGLRQFLLTPYKFVKLVEILLSSDFHVKKIDFNPIIEPDDFIDLDVLLSHNDMASFISILDAEITYIDEELDSIPSKITFSKGGYDYSIYNNGIVFVEDDKLLIELNDVFASLLNEKGAH
ncbi:hypothetical protein [Priestia aryabhattai]|uniref:hypothetical protein n=1 Tax=Priestia aryabhattai TaxID=412384 RepID=UPI003734D895